MWRRLAADGRELVEECERFLQGGYAEHLAAAGRPVPVWAWLNLLAHGTEADLRSVCALEARNEACTVWDQARRFLAGEVLTSARGRDVTAVQRAVLVPLELDLAADPGVEQWRPSQLVSAVLVALSDRSRPRRG